VLTVLPDALAVPLERVHSRVRKSQKGPEQYQRRSDRHAQRPDRHADSEAEAGSAADVERVRVREGGLEFW